MLADVGAECDEDVPTLAAMGAVGQVLWAHDKALFVFLGWAVGGCMVARAFCYCHDYRLW